MYTQGLDSLGKESVHVGSADTAALEARFQGRVDADDKIEPKESPVVPADPSQAIAVQIPGSEIPALQKAGRFFVQITGQSA